MPRKATKTTTTTNTETTAETKATKPRATRGPKVVATKPAPAPAPEVKAEAAKPAPKMPDRKKLYEECKKKLLKTKEDHLAHFDRKREAISEHISGDDGDVANASEEQDIAVSRRENLLHLLSEIEIAFERLAEGTYGVCEETGELIEAERLLAIPWTRLSLEGAIAREKEEGESYRRRA